MGLGALGIGFGSVWRRFGARYCIRAGWVLVTFLLAAWYFFDASSMISDVLGSGLARFSHMFLTDHRIHNFHNLLYECDDLGGVRLASVAGCVLAAWS